MAENNLKLTQCSLVFHLFFFYLVEKGSRNSDISEFITEDILYVIFWDLHMCTLTTTYLLKTYLCYNEKMSKLKRQLFNVYS